MVTYKYYLATSSVPTLHTTNKQTTPHQSSRDERPHISLSTMDNGRKRSFESSELLEQDELSRYEQGRLMNAGETGDSAIRNELPTSSLNASADECPEIPLNEAGSESDLDKGRETRNERRLEINRQRAKDIRKRKKQMIEEMQKQIILLTIENNKLRAQNQMQRAELTLLHNSLKPILPNQQSMLHMNAARPLATSDVRGSIQNIGNNTGALPDFLQASDVGNSPALINPNSTIPASTGYAIPSLHNPSFTPNLVTSSASGMIGNDLHLPAVDSNVQTNPNFALPTVGSSSLQMADMMNGDEHNSQNISSEMQSMSAMDSRSNQLLLSLLHERQLANSNYRPDLGDGGM